MENKRMMQDTGKAGDKQKGEAYSYGDQEQIGRAHV